MKTVCLTSIILPLGALRDFTLVITLQQKLLCCVNIVIIGTREETTTGMATTKRTTSEAMTTMEPTMTPEVLTMTLEIASTQSAQLPVRCCCRCCYDDVTSSCTVCDDESLADAAQCAAQRPPSPTPITRSTEPNFEAPQKLQGSRFEERLAFTEEFLAKEQLTELLASISVSEKTALGFSASEFILDCNYDGIPCHSE